MYIAALAAFLIPAVVALLCGVSGRAPGRHYELATGAISGLFVASILLPRQGGQNVGLTCVFPSVESLLIVVACGLLLADRMRGGLRYFAPLAGYYLLTYAGAYHQFAYDDGKAPFIVQGADETLDRLESIYFALVTASTTGFGDVVPNTSMARGIVSLQILTGFVLFGCLLVQVLGQSGAKGA